jgi:guanylate kinase
LEWEQVHNYYYGTSRILVNQWMAQGKVVLLDIDVNGALSIQRKFNNSTVSIFLEPPSKNELIKRLKNRKTESRQEIAKRLERLPIELEKKKYFDFVIQNNNLENTVKETLNIIKTKINRGGNS